MARGRMINQSIATDKRLNSLSVDAELVYLMTIPHLDRDGLILGEPNMLASQVCPRRPELRPYMDSIINEWVTLGLVLRYEGKEDPILFFVGFAKNQGGLRYDRETPSQFPPPPGYKRTNDGLEPVTENVPSRNSGTTPAEVRQPSPPYPAEVNRSEEKRNVGGTPPTQNTRTRADHAQQQSARHMRQEYPGIDPKLLTGMTNHVKRIYGYSALINKPGSDDLEDKLRGEAYRLWELGFDSDQKMQNLAVAWRDHAVAFKDKRPYGDQLYQEAVRLISQEVATTPATVDFAFEELV